MIKIFNFHHSGKFKGIDNRIFDCGKGSQDIITVLKKKKLFFLYIYYLIVVGQMGIFQNYYQQILHLGVWSIIQKGSDENFL